MSRDHFAALGLPPGRYSREALAAHFASQRAAAMARLADGRQRVAAERELDALHLAHRALSASAGQDVTPSAATLSVDRVAVLRRIIDWSLEDGLMRYSRRQQVLDAGRSLGFSEFHIHLMIAQAQFCDSDALAPFSVEARPEPADKLRARLAAIVVVALALFLGLLRWAG